jgi:hypothetical protein
LERHRSTHKCPACGAAFLQSDYCPECGHVLEEVVRLHLAFTTTEDLQRHFGRSPTFETLFLPARQAVPEGTLVSLRLVLPTPWGELTVPARVTAIAHTPSTPESPYRLQLALLQLDAEKKAMLRSVVTGGAGPNPRVVHLPAQEAAARAPLVIHLPSRPASAPRAPTVVVLPPQEPAGAAPPTTTPELAPPAGQVEIDIDLEDLLAPLVPAVAPAPTPTEEQVETIEVWTAPRERPPEQLSQLVTDFVRRLTKAVTSATYYDAEHGYAQQAKVGLYDTFRLLVDDSTEITLLAQQSDVKRSIQVYGVFDEPTDLEQVMTRGQAELFVPKLAGYFETKSLLSISFKRSLEHAEFHRFVDLLAAPVHQARGAPLDFASVLASQHVRNVSVVFRQEFLSRRKLSWRVALALTRLRKDLSVLPLYEGRTAEELRQVRLQVVRDVIRPLRQVEVLRELLSNCDLVANEVECLDQEELELMVQACLTPAALPDLLTGFAHDVVAAVRADPGRAGHLIRLTRNLARKLARSQQDVGDAVFRQLCEHGVIAPEELPVALQDRIRVEGKVDVFMRAWRQHLAVFEAAGAVGDYRRHLDFFSLVFAELLCAREYDVAVKMSLIVARHAAVEEGFPGRQSLAAEWLAGLGTSGAGDEIVRQLLYADKLRRQSLLTLCGVMGEGGVPVLFRALCDCPTRSVRQELCDLLEALKPSTQRFLAAELGKKAIPWYFQRNLVNLLGRVGDQSDLPLVSHFLADKHPRVRLEAILTACALDEAGAERALVAGLADVDPDIRAVCLRQLVQRRSTATELFDHLGAMLESLEPSESEAALQACGLLAGYQSGEGHERAVDLLLAVLKDQPRRGFWSRIAGAPADRHVLKVAVCQTLGRLRARRAVPELARLAEGGHKTLKPAATKALRQIEVAPETRTEPRTRPPTL